MDEIIREWLSKAEADLATAERELQATETPNYDAVCFHAQQGIEKLIKALLIHHDSPAPKTHDLVYLNELLSQKISSCVLPIEELRYLTRAAVDFRYPGESADFEEAKEACVIAERIRKILVRYFDR